MVLYYKKIKNESSDEKDTKSNETPKGYNMPAITSKIQEPEIRNITHDSRLPAHKELFNELYKTPFSDRKQLYYSLLEDNFNSLSIDDKLVVMYKTAILRTNTTNNYILMCLALLVIIALKLYSK